MKTLKRTTYGTYIAHNGWEIRKHCDTGRWNMINPETGSVFDSSEKLDDLRRVYGIPKQDKMPSDAQFLSAIGPCGK